MFDARKLLDQLLSSPMPGTTGTVREKAGDAVQLAKDNPLATGAIAAVLLGTGTGRQIAGTALKLGGLAAIAGLGYQAWKNYKAGKDPVTTPTPQSASTEPLVLPAPEGSGFEPSLIGHNSDFPLALIRVMIAAARADGHIDDDERARILDRLKGAGLGADAEAFIAHELEAPLDLDGLVAAATSEEQKVELYTAARLTISPDTRAERGFLDLLAGRLGLADALIDHIEASVASAKA